MAKKVGLVLTGGGARNAYQAGVLMAISEILPSNSFPFPIITGISAGSINAAFLACSSGNFHQSAKKLYEIWHNLESHKVFRLSKFGFISFAFRAFLNILLGDFLKTKWPASFLDNSPLEYLLSSNIDPKGIANRINNGELLAVCFSASDFTSNKMVSFFESHNYILPWQKSDHMGVRTYLNTKHVMASSAIPAIFKLVKINGSYFGDGSTRVAYPISPAIHLGAEKILAIDMRSLEPSPNQVVSAKTYPGLGEVFAKLLDSIFSDSLYKDIERLEIINKFAANNHSESSHYKEIPFLLIRPSRHLGHLAENIFDSLSFQLKGTLKIFGASRFEGADLISHLAFESVYTKKLLQLGYEDGITNKSNILNFFNK